jgi:hypothetical protein
MTQKQLSDLLWKASGRILAVDALLQAGDPGAAEVQLETLAQELTRALGERRGS